MHVIAIIAALLLMVPAALAGILSGLAHCLSHRPDPNDIAENVSALLVALGPFGSGLLLITAGLGLMVAVVVLLRQR
jgi:hypothetical protein